MTEALAILLPIASLDVAGVPSADSSHAPAIEATTHPSARVTPTGTADRLALAAFHLPQERRLPAAGRTDALLDEDDGRLEIASSASGSACKKAGLKTDDQILSVDGHTITNMADLKLVMWNKSPGDRIEVEIRRPRWLLGPSQLTLEIVPQ